MDPRTGEIKQFDTEEEFQKAIKSFGLIPLPKLPKKNCLRCFGRGYVGYNTTTGKHVLCRCVL